MKMPTPPMEEWGNVSKWDNPTSKKPLTKKQLKNKRKKRFKKKPAIIYRTPM